MTDIPAWKRLFRKSRALVAFRNPQLQNLGTKLIPKRPAYRHLPVLGAMIIQQADSFILNFKDERMRYEGESAVFQNQQTLRDIALAWGVCWTGNSNTITIARNGQVLVNSVGGQDRVGACKVAGDRLGENERHFPGLVAASDSFFPFSDGLLKLRSYGVNTIFTTQGGERQSEVAEEARKNGMSLMWIDDKVARGFYGH